jgi:hypothetical protein
MPSSAARAVIALTVLASLALDSPARAAAEPPPPTDAELTKYVAVQDALAGDVARREAICALMNDDSDSGNGRDGDVAAAGRRLEANPIFGPLLRQKGLAGRRYAELTVQIAGVLIGAAIAEENDAAERAKGRPAKSRDTLLASSPAAPPILARQADLTRALEGVQAVCEGDSDDGYDGEGYENEPPEGGAVV